MYYYFIGNKIVRFADKVYSGRSDVVELTESQVLFYLENPEASVNEVRNCKLNQPYEPVQPTLSEIKDQAIIELDKLSRLTLGKSVDTLAFCDALAGTIYAQSRGLESIYSGEEILTTADEFLTKGKLCRDKYKEVSELINNAESIEVVNQLMNDAKDYYEGLSLVTDNLELHKRIKLRQIEVYDTSSEVNGFFFNGILMWLDKESRTSLVNTINSSELLGRNSVNIWFQNIYITLDTVTARQMLAELELYATDCYNVTALHKVQVNQLTSIEEVDAFDITADYPERPRFDGTIS